MARAYTLARAHNPHPNPRVGAVIVSPEGNTIGEGAHEGPGRPHAEIVALDQAGAAADATVYVTLEPCSHHGRTPPCVERLVDEGVARVVVGAVDPDERVSGRGISALREAGVEVEVLDEPEARETDPAYFRHRETGMPLVTIKWAMTLDGSVAAADGTSQWITSPDTRMQAHELRSRVDAVVVGAGTLRSDDPRLDVRLPGYQGPQPRPVVVAGTGDLPESAQLWDRNPLVMSGVDREIPGGELVVVDGSEGRPDPTAVCRDLADRGLLHLLLEGGPTLAGAWWRAGVVDSGVAHIGARIGGGAGRPPLGGGFATITDADDVEFVAVRSVSGDVAIEFRRKQA
jgi:diaminohydroxyphosphoribosylaminopyrimidine deaminase / 5-amino-6-(5-phosphoribosylamino)uracil reductase